MTEKRFMIDDCGTLIDMVTRDTYDYVSDVVDLLNQLSDENEQLKTQLQNTFDQRDEFFRGARENTNRVGKLKKENEQLKQQNQEYQAILQDMGILLTDNEVINLRNEIADKLLKPMFKSNGFDVDIDTADGFTIIPKGDVE